MSEKTKKGEKELVTNQEGQNTANQRHLPKCLEMGTRDHETPRAIFLESENDRHKVAETKTKKTHDPLTWQTICNTHTRETC